MVWAKITSLFFLATFKFLFAPYVGMKMDLNYVETFFICISGATLSSAVFYFSSEYFMKRARIKRREKRENALRMGMEFKEPKKFTRVNKAIIWLKRKLGIYGICFYVPLFLSIPIGSIIVAKFYGRLKKTFPLILLGICLNGFILTALSYLFL